MAVDLTLTKCRTCMKEGTKYYQLYDYIEEDDNGRILEMLDAIVPQIHIKEESQLSGLICQQCIDQLLTGYKFQRLCIETDKHLRRLMGMSPHDGTDLKPENIWDPLMEEERLAMKLEVEDPGANEREIKPDNVEVVIKYDNALEEEGGIGTDGSDTDSSNEKLSVLRERKLRISLKIGNNENSSKKSSNSSECGKNCKRKSRLKANRSVHTKKRTFSCDICKYSCATEKTLKTHKQIHKGEDKSKPIGHNETEVIDSQTKVVPEKIEVSPQIFEESIDDFSDNAELLDNKDNPVDLEDELAKNDDLLDTGISTEKSNINNRRSGKFPCEVCGMVFDRLFRLKRHSSVHSLDKPHACDICKRRFFSAKYLKAHKMKHKNQSSSSSSSSQLSKDGLKCPDCPSRFENKASLKVHRKMHTSNYSIEGDNCHICKSSFLSSKSLIKHITNEHPEAEKHACDQCDETFVLHVQLVKHRKRCNRNLFCVICEKDFKFKSSLEKHMRSHSGERPYLCPQCGKTFRSSSNLSEHMTRHSGLPSYQCPECPGRFKCGSDLRKHTATHTNLKPHVCDICGFRFTRAYSLQEHKRLHSGEKPYQCDQCSKAFAIVYHLKRHMRTHTGEKPYKCKYCERAYTVGGDLTKHLRTHLGEKTYMCDQCPMAFKYHSELREHLTAHFKMGQQLQKQAAEKVPDEVEQLKTTTLAETSTTIINSN